MGLINAQMSPVERKIEDVYFYMANAVTLWVYTVVICQVTKMKSLRDIFVDFYPNDDGKRRENVTKIGTDGAFTFKIYKQKEEKLIQFSIYVISK